MNFWRMIILFFIIQLAVGFLFNYLGWPSAIAEVVITLIVSFVYAYYYDRFDGVPWYRNLAFHRTFSVTFIILLAINLIFMML